ncbi:MAG: ADP-ribosylglycohydrolase family protein [Halothiobacillaceae bacterium]
MTTLQDRFTGCLLGGAVGDALGAPVEFMSREQILQRFGPGGIRDFAPAYGGIGRITDDTQMTLFTAEGLLEAHAEDPTANAAHYRRHTAEAYLRWLHTQDEAGPVDTPEGTAKAAGLWAEPALHSQRAPGNTCLSALRATTTPGVPAVNDSKGCGGVMRVAPVGLFCLRIAGHDRGMDAFSLGRDLAALTHAHPTGYLTAGVLALLIQAIAGGLSLTAALRSARSRLQRAPNHEETLQAIDHAVTLSESDLPRTQAIEELGAGWIAEEALAISLYCSLVAPNFEEGVILAVNHDGDSDSTGAITGNLLGAGLGIKAIPPRWLHELELREVTLALALALHDLPGQATY